MYIIVLGFLPQFHHHTSIPVQIYLHLSAFYHFTHTSHPHFTLTDFRNTSHPPPHAHKFTLPDFCPHESPSYLQVHPRWFSLYHPHGFLPCRPRSKINSSWLGPFPSLSSHNLFWHFANIQIIQNNPKHNNIMSSPFQGPLDKLTGINKSTSSLTKKPPAKTAWAKLMDPPPI